MRIEPMTDRHADQVLAIYQAGIDEGNATFEICPPAWPQFVAGKLPGHSYVAAGDGGVLGWVAAGQDLAPFAGCPYGRHKVLYLLAGLPVATRSEARYYRTMRAGTLL